MLPIKKLNLIRRFICRPAKLNERGFFTIVGLCLLLVAAIFIKGVHEFEANYSRGIINFQIEHHLQNLAESYLIETKETATIDENELSIMHRLGDMDIDEFKLKNVSVEIRAKHTNIKIQHGKNTAEENLPIEAEGIVIVSVASCDSPFIAGKMYRRAFAYILEDDPATIHFLNSL